MRDVLDYLFQSTLPARGATARGRRKPAGSRISIHAPRTGSDNSRLICVTSSVRFQSTLPARGATSQMTENASGMELFQSTLPARGATAYNADIPRIAVISIHAPRTGSDNVPRTQIGLRQHFNPRSPHGERQFRGRPFSWLRDFNPRSPHGERRFGDLQLRLALQNFNPRSPHGERPNNVRLPRLLDKFQSTLPARGATCNPSDKVHTL